MVNPANLQVLQFVIGMTIDLHLTEVYYGYTYELPKAHLQDLNF